MIRRVLRNWQGKVASLLVAWVIWFLIYDNLSRPREKYDPALYPVPGTAPAAGSVTGPETLEIKPLLDVPVPGAKE